MLESSQKGISLYLAIMIMTILLAMALGVSTILLSQAKTIREMGDSVIALYAADSGMERELYEKNPAGTKYSGSLDGASYNVSVIASGAEGCPAVANYCVKSVGIYGETRRALQVAR